MAVATWELAFDSRIEKNMFHCHCCSVAQQLPYTSHGCVVLPNCVVWLQQCLMSLTKSKKMVGGGAGGSDDIGVRKSAAGQEHLLQLRNSTEL